MNVGKAYGLAFVTLNWLVVVIGKVVRATCSEKCEQLSEWLQVGKRMWF